MVGLLFEFFLFSLNLPNALLRVSVLHDQIAGVSGQLIIQKLTLGPGTDRDHFSYLGKMVIDISFQGMVNLLWLETWSRFFSV